MDNKVDRVEPQPAELPEKPYPEVHHIQNNSSFDQGKGSSVFWASTRATGGQVTRQFGQYKSNSVQNQYSVQ
jgi:hypothetical protein